MKKIGWIVIILVVLAIAGYFVWMFAFPAPAPIATNNPQFNNNSQSAATNANQPVVQAHGIKIAMVGGKAILADDQSMSLYYFANDRLGVSNCPPGPCLTAWPVFLADTLSVESPLNPADFAVITRADNAKQTTYKGWPLYYFAKDKKAGDMKGEGVQKTWYVVPLPFYTVMLQNQPVANGNYLIDGGGRTLYYFKNDTQGVQGTAAKSACTGNCLTAWPAFNADNIILPSALSAVDFASVTRDDGVKQLAYKGWPLYYYFGDAAPGDLNGQGFNNLWSVVAP
jgi:predicted lipoprotein with Yx(FWY)xxD motif